MLNLKSIIQQLPEEEYNRINVAFKGSRGDKYALLFKLYRENNHSDNQVKELLHINTNAFYTLKSRLYDKLQQHLDAPVQNASKIDILNRVSNITNLLFNTPKDTAIATLKKLEQDLAEADMPHELTAVYNALKKLHANSPKYYDYSQLYNRHVAYTLSIEKTEELVMDFYKKAGQYYLSRDEEIIAYLILIKQEVNNTALLYRSHRLSVYADMMSIFLALLLPEHEATQNDDPIEDLLARIGETTTGFSEDTVYKSLGIVHRFLAFEYYHSLKVHKKADEYFDIVNNNLNTFLLYDFCTFPSKFLISKLERYTRLNKEPQLHDENLNLLSAYVPDKNDITNYVNYSIYLAMSAYYAKDYDEAASILSNLRNEVNLKDYPHADIEVRLLLSLLYTLQHEIDLALNMMRSVSRKLSEQKAGNYENVKLFIKLLQTSMNKADKGLSKKITQLAANFKLHNQAGDMVLSYLKTDESFIDRLINKKYQ